MHPSALNNGRCFFQAYGSSFADGARVLDIGAYDVNGSLRAVTPPTWEYVGVDFSPGPGVDVVLDDPYQLPFQNGAFDAVVSSSCFEHSEMFWILFLEALRVLKPEGLLYLNVPTNGSFHRYPVDCWRFFPDSGKALEKWAHRNNLFPKLLESFVSHQQVNPWNDFVAVYVRETGCAPVYLERMCAARDDIENVYSSLAGDNLLKFSAMTEDLRCLRDLRKPKIDK